MSDAVNVKELRPVFSPEQIACRVRELAEEINECYGLEPLVVVCVLKGGFLFFSDLVRFLHHDNLELDFVRLSSYGKKASSPGHVIFSKDIEIDIRDQTCPDRGRCGGQRAQHAFSPGSVRGPQAAQLAPCSLVDKQSVGRPTCESGFCGIQTEQGLYRGVRHGLCRTLSRFARRLRNHTGIDIPARSRLMFLWSSGMEVKCPHCSSRFNLPDSLAKAGAKLRCSVCKTVFPFQPEPLDREGTLPESGVAPAARNKERPGRRKLWFALLLLLGLAGGAYWHYASRDAVKPLSEPGACQEGGIAHHAQCAPILC